ncbi:MAG: nucleotide exchange factor GrpE [Flavobacteriales bacterium]|nr:nucleotide exchange factor GrpE [Flavobacteriales bacterium]
MPKNKEKETIKTEDTIEATENVNEEKMKEETTGSEGTVEEAESSEEPNVNGVNEWETKYHEVNDKYLRLYSEFENFRKRTAKERLDLLSTAGGDVIKKMLPVLDDFDRAIKANDESEDTAALKEGFSLIRQKMFGILSQEGLKPMESLETIFDTDLHEAITQIPAPKDDLKGKVVDVIEKGYYLNEKVLRFAKVVIGN